jgi:type IV pilus assembly protein PilB
MDKPDPYDLSELTRQYHEDIRRQFERWSQGFGIPYVDLSVYVPYPDALAAIPREMAERWNVIPVYKEGDILYVAMADIHDLQAADEIRLACRCQVRGVIAAPEDIRLSIRRCYGGEEE